MDIDNSKLKKLLAEYPGYCVSHNSGTLCITQSGGDTSIHYHLKLIPYGDISELIVTIIFGEENVEEETNTMKFIGEMVYCVGPDADVLDDEIVIRAVYIGLQIYHEYLNILGSYQTVTHILCFGKVFDEFGVGDPEFPNLHFKRSNDLKQILKMIEYCKMQIEIDESRA